MENSKVFDLIDVHYEYRPGEKAVGGINLTVDKGEKIALLGPNGCGKSTLQKILAGLIFAEGQLLAFGNQINSRTMRDKHFAASYRRKVGFVFQNSDVQVFCASVLDEVMFGPLAMGVSYDEAKNQAEELLDFIGITHLVNRMPHHLSGGEKKKVAIAAVLAVNPDVLILDEPTNGLDPKTQRWMINTVNELNRCGKTIITATHQLNLVQELADRIIVMDGSHRIMADGDWLSVLTNRDLLLSANLIDEYYHVHIHGEDGHVHVHKHD